MSTKCSSGAGPYPLCPFGTSPLDKGSRPRGVLPNPSLLPAKPSEAGSPGRGGARERTQFSPPGGNGVEWTLRRRAAMGKVGRRPQAAKSPMKRSPLRSGHRVVAQASFFDPAGQFIFSHPTEKPPPLSACHSADPPASRAGAQNKMERTARRGQPSPFSFYNQIILHPGGTAYRYTSSRRGRFLRKTRRFAPGRAFRGALVPPGGPPPLDQGTGVFTSHPGGTAYRCISST